MAVTIHEFEVVNEPLTTSAPSQVAPPPNEGEALPTPEELAQLLRHQLERERRVWAH